MEYESEKELFQFNLKFCIHFSIGIFYMFVAKQTILDNLLVQSKQYCQIYGIEIDIMLCKFVYNKHDIAKFYLT